MAWLTKTILSVPVVLDKDAWHSDKDMHYYTGLNYRDASAYDEYGVDECKDYSSIQLKAICENKLTGNRSAKFFMRRDYYRQNGKGHTVTLSRAKIVRLVEKMSDEKNVNSHPDRPSTVRARVACYKAALALM